MTKQFSADIRLFLDSDDGLSTEITHLARIRQGKWSYSFSAKLYGEQSEREHSVAPETDAIETEGRVVDAPVALSPGDAE